MDEHLESNVASARNDQEREQHARAVELLSRDLNLPQDEVMRLYSTTLDMLKKDAKIKTYLPVLVCRSVKERLQKK